MAELTCRELVELVTAYFDGALPGNERARFEGHLSACPGCRTYVEQMRQTVALVGGLRAEDVSPEAEARLLHAFRDWKSHQRDA